jgi:hypothetical protein
VCTDAHMFPLTRLFIIKHIKALQAKVCIRVLLPTARLLKKECTVAASHGMYPQLQTGHSVPRR